MLLIALLILLLDPDLDERIRVIFIEINGAVSHFLLFMKNCLLLRVSLRRVEVAKVKSRSTLPSALHHFLFKLLFIFLGKFPHSHVRC